MMVWKFGRWFSFYRGPENSQVPGVNLPGCNLSPFYLLSWVPDSPKCSVPLLNNSNPRHSAPFSWDGSTKKAPSLDGFLRIKKNGTTTTNRMETKKCLKSWSFAMSGCVFFAKKNKSCIPFCASFVESSFCWPVRILVFWSVNRKPPFAQQDLTSLFWGNSSDSEWFFFHLSLLPFDLWAEITRRTNKGHYKTPTQTLHYDKGKSSKLRYCTFASSLIPKWVAFHDPPSNFSPDSESLPWSLHWPPWHASETLVVCQVFCCLWARTISKN